MTSPSGRYGDRRGHAGRREASSFGVHQVVTHPPDSVGDAPFSAEQAAEHLHAQQRHDLEAE